ncbi:MAG: hypothetical protein L0Y50_00665 [Beijerinckiaceae bacterium]|nr:hypothetical protein [Beijerinckiaceae bacterium]MCI0734785.1 hypothetical protein [Beijerinckiaceae bacterium]
MRMTTVRTISVQSPVRTGLTLGLAFASMVAVTAPSRAGAVEILNTVPGILDSFNNIVNPPKPAPPSPPPQKIQYVPVPVYHHSPHYTRPARPDPRHCYYQKRVDYDGADYIHSKEKVCQASRPAPRHCWYEGRSFHDGRDRVHSKVKVCR